MPGLPNFQLYQRSYRSMILEVYDRSQCSVVFKSFRVKCIGCRFQKQAREWAWESWRETIYHQDQLEDKELHLLGIAIAPSIYMEKKMYNMLVQLLYSEVKKMEKNKKDQEDCSFSSVMRHSIEKQDQWKSLLCKELLDHP